MSDVWMLRTGILIAGVLLIAAIYFFGRPRKPGQGRRIEGREGVRVEPTIGAQLEAELSAGRCDAFTADVSELASLRSGMRKPDDFRILSEQISKEPLAQLVRATDVDLFDVLRWTIFAMIAAEELGVTSANVAGMAKSGNPDVRRLLGVTPGNGKALGLDEAWASNVIKTVGNYGEVYERNVGMRSPVKLPRGVNALPSAGGLMFAPPLR